MQAFGRTYKFFSSNLLVDIVTQIFELLEKGAHKVQNKGYDTLNFNPYYKRSYVYPIACHKGKEGSKVIALLCL
jgi:hypothetical protein